nr:AAA family ATPase [uncultured Pseudodesulfovibrio sp.]
MITKIPSVCSFGSFSSFDWDSTVRCPGNNVVEFNKLNILYGRNYSGKTTLSRVLRSIERKFLHEDYTCAKFEVQDSVCGIVCEKNIEKSKLNIRVYNTDFVKDNLKWLQDRNGNIEPFAIVGAKNIEIEKQIEALENEIGGDNSGLMQEIKNLTQNHYDKNKAASKAANDQANLLKDYAVKIKKNSIRYNFPTYTITTIKQDIATIQTKDYSLTEDSRQKLLQITQESVKPEISPIEIRIPCYSDIVDKTVDLLGKTVTPSQSIKELLEDSSLQEWVREGALLHKNQREICAFCGGALDDQLWGRIDAHFSKESEKLRTDLESVIKKVQSEIELFSNKIAVPEASIYSQLREQIHEQQNEGNNTISEYRIELNRIKNELEERTRNIFKSIDFKMLFNKENDLVNIQNAINTSIEQNNFLTSEIDKQKLEARYSLRLDAVQAFLKTIRYDEGCAQIEKLKNAETVALECLQNKSKELETKRNRILILKSELSDETKGAEQVNNYLRHYFGHNALNLAAQKDESGAKFILQRGEEKAHNLSEGECSLVAFCYFMAKLDEVGFDGKQSIIWIDDPISSLDNNHVFFIFSLIENVLAKPKNYEQLFISTHSLDFLKYLKRISHPHTVNENGKRVRLTSFFIIENDNRCSRLRPMPKHLENYITEFNYLFSVIYKCANSTSQDVENFDHYYGFGNNLRKFLEAFLFYKYPNNLDLSEKMDLFFDKDHKSTTLVNRVVNEFSHLEEIFDRSTAPIDVPEMMTIAKYVLDKIKENDEDQFNALLKSIGVAA